MEVSSPRFGRAVVLFTGNADRESRAKGLPRGALPLLHRRIRALVRRMPHTALIEARETRRGMELVGMPGSGVVVAGRDPWLKVEHAVSAVRAVFSEVVVLAGDVAGLTSGVVEDAFRRLQSGDDAVVGRSPDGGFYLAAFRPGIRIEWTGLQWGGSTVASDFISRLRTAGLRVTESVSLADADDASSLERSRRDCCPGLAAALGALMDATIYVSELPLLSRLLVVSSNPLRAPPSPAI
ncbi:MAG TPA: DUF2064 domain-containing protein [Thermoanaerobaculia bacterium]|nr:DUF2064 domain-containing protein [Thermoanaerobaculia bacterium]